MLIIISADRNDVNTIEEQNRNFSDVCLYCPCYGQILCVIYNSNVMSGIQHFILLTC